MHCAYYAVYHKLAEHFGLDTSKSADHAAIRDKLQRLSGTSHPAWVWSARRNIKQLWTYRVTADYHLKQAIEAADAEAAVETAIIVLR